MLWARFASVSAELHFKKVHRCAVNSLECRAAQHNHDEISKAAKALLEKIDAED